MATTERQASHRSGSPLRLHGMKAVVLRKKSTMKWNQCISLLVTFVGSFIAFAFVYYLLDLSSGFLALGPNGNKEPFFFQIMDFLDRVGGFFTGVPFHKRNAGRAILFYATIFALWITFLDHKRMQNQKKDRK
ncbi:hypothetical protein [Janthinobacterium sp. TND4EL3]|uniref:hypothetical protein n=1 Tax=Janthinobacterium sp. TND4EL3 TaxID=1907311 RepID=UPI0011159097|nr:hypothetical protein [Janthinobacterium sp. TND4EL3]